MNTKTSRMINELGGRKKRSGLAALMSPTMIISLVLIGIFSFTALVTLSGYAGDLRQKNNGQAHALSRSAIGYGGLARLLGDVGYNVQMSRTENVIRDEDNVLRIFTLSRPFQADKLDDLNLYTPTLIIMPKWSVMPIEGEAGWVRKGFGPSTFKVDNHNRDLKELTGEITFKAKISDDKSLAYNLSTEFDGFPILNAAEIENLQTLDKNALGSIYFTSEGDVLVRLEDRPVYILTDPDFMNTMGINSKSRAKFALGMIDAIIDYEDADIRRVDFDLTLHGFGGKTNVIKVLTQPPFLAATLCLLAAGGLIAWQAFSRFGEPLVTPRDYALGKFSLADNAARFIRIAGRETNMADDYAILVKTQTIKALNLKGRKAQDIDKILKRREEALNLETSWADLHARTAHMKDKTALMQLALELDKWKHDMTQKMKAGDKL